MEAFLVKTKTQNNTRCNVTIELITKTLPGDWKRLLTEFINKDSFSKLANFLQSEFAHKTVFPPLNQVFKAFVLCSFESVKVVIIGQDPYHAPGQATGLAFSVPPAIPLPSSLQNIRKELFVDLKQTLPNGDLTFWAQQGVLMLNTVLTVEKGKPASHKNKGWEQFTECVLQKLSDQKEKLVFILWGANAREKEHLLDSRKHLVLKSAHPSGLSAHKGFFGSKVFSKTNAWLKKQGLDEIRWGKTATSLFSTKSVG